MKVKTAKLALQVKRLWKKCLAYDKISDTMQASFVVFSDKNPFVETYQLAMELYLKALRLENKKEMVSIVNALIDTVERMTSLENVYNDKNGENFSWSHVLQEFEKFKSL
jgi:hypothetical protein